VVRAFFPSIIVSSAIFLAPCAHGNTLLPGPTGSAPTDKSFFLTFGPGDARSYVVDPKGFYERDGWSSSDNSRIGAFNDDEGSRNKGFSSNLSFNGFNSKGSSGGIGGSFSGGASNGGGLSISGGSGFFSMKGLGEGGGFAGGNKGSDSGSGGLGSEGAGSKGLGDPPGVSATPLPASWTMMLIGLAIGLLAWCRNLKRSAANRLIPATHEISRCLPVVAFAVPRISKE
jgi:hypothetical protein